LGHNDIVIRILPMTNKPKSRVKFFVVLVIVVFWFICLPVPSFLFAPYDAARLAMFAHRIAGADRVVGTYLKSSVSLTLTGEDARRLTKAVSTASSDRPPYGRASSCSFLGQATFFKGTNLLDHIEICSSLFLIHNSQPPFQDDSGSLDALIYTPITRAIYDREMEKVPEKPTK